MANKLAFKVFGAALLLLLVLQFAAGRHVAEKSCVDDAKLATVAEDVDDEVQIEGAFKELNEDEISDPEFDEEVVSLVDEGLGAPRWGPFSRGPCVRSRRGFRRYTARLLGVRGGNWNATCHNTPATIGRHRNLRPARCIRTRRGEITGVFHVRDRSCRRVSDLEKASETGEAFEAEDALEDSLEITDDAISDEEMVSLKEEVAAARWGRFRRGPCLRTRRGFRSYTARLFGVGDGNWNATCLNTTATIHRHRNIRPARCTRNRGGQIIGVFHVRDRRCGRVSDLEEAFEVKDALEDSLELSENVISDIESHEKMVMSFEEDEVAAPRWGPFRRGPCLRRRRGFRRYTALLFGVSSGNWSSTCLNTTATIGSHRSLHPVQCRRNRRGQITGVFHVRDRRCRRVRSDLEELEIEAFEVHEEALQNENALELEDSVERELEDEIEDEEEADFLDQGTALDGYEPAEALAGSSPERTTFIML